MDGSVDRGLCLLRAPQECGQGPGCCVLWYAPLPLSLAPPPPLAPWLSLPQCLPFRMWLCVRACVLSGHACAYMHVHTLSPHVHPAPPTHKCTHTHFLTGSLTLTLVLALELALALSRARARPLSLTHSRAPPLPAQKEYTLAHVSKILLATGFHHLWVVDSDHQLVGLVSFTDIFRQLCI